mmetsp:Transcript_14628/g.63358  ORF Transcript_14628/g.63358 Transcript_14628/m.63358 type:complete len:225 (-) Transcript_14628:1262-1936(-)
MLPTGMLQSMFRDPSSGSQHTAIVPPGSSSRGSSVSSLEYQRTPPHAARCEAKISSATTSSFRWSSPVAFRAPPATEPSATDDRAGALRSSRASSRLALASATMVFVKSSRSRSVSANPPSPSPFPPSRPPPPANDASRGSAVARDATACCPAGAAFNCAHPNVPDVIQSPGRFSSASFAFKRGIPHPSSALSVRSASNGAGKQHVTSSNGVARSHRASPRSLR